MVAEDIVNQSHESVTVKAERQTAREAETAWERKSVDTG